MASNLFNYLSIFLLLTLGSIFFSFSFNKKVENHVTVPYAIEEIEKDNKIMMDSIVYKKIDIDQYELLLDKGVVVTIDDIVGKCVKNTIPSHGYFYLDNLVECK